jgi:hypothetical protein
MPSSKLQPALLGGLLLGVLSALPLVQAGNLCCCLWVLAGGATAAYLLQRGQAAPITFGDGAVVGFMAGLFGAVVWMAVSVPVELVMQPIRSMLTGRLPYGSELPDTAQLPEQARALVRALSENTALTFVLKGIATFFISTIFSTLGGLIGAGLFRAKVPPPPATPAPPVSMPGPPGPPPSDSPWSANS